MKTNYLGERIEEVNCQEVKDSLNQNGYALIKNFLLEETCAEWIGNYSNDKLYRKTINMERFRFGKGEYKYFAYPLPDDIQLLREKVYPKLAPLANGWMKMLGMPVEFPGSLLELQRLCHSHHQTKPTVLILKYEAGGHNTLHQDLYGEIFFPFQMVFFLNKVGEDYEGGEFVLVQQIPRAQSKAIVLNPSVGDMLIFTTQFRPMKGTKGYFRVNMKHGVSEVRKGQRHTLGIIFHDAQ